MTDQVQLLGTPPHLADRARASVTVIVPVRNEAAYIERTLDQLLDQELDGIELEILIVDGQSTDGTPEIVQRYADQFSAIRLLENPRRLSSAARNLAIEHSQGEYVVIIDGHCEIPTRRYFIELVDGFEESSADCLGRPQPLNVEHASPFQRAVAAARSSRLGHHPESFIYSNQPQFVPAKSVAVAYRRDVFDRVGFFDEAFDAHEDGEFNYRCDQAGLRCYFTPEIAIHYSPRASLPSLFKQMVRYGRGRVRFSQKHAGTWGLGTLVPALLVLYIIVGSGLAILLPEARLPYVTGLTVYGAALAVTALRIAVRYRNMAFVIRVPLVLLATHLGAGVGVLVEWVFDRRLPIARNSA